MSKELLVIAGPDTGRTFPLTPGVPLVIGRGQASATRLADRHVSKVHCQVEWDGDDLVVVDQESTGGTFVNGVRVSRQTLQPGSVIRIGETQLRVQGEGTAGAKEDETLAGFLPAGREAAPAAVEPLMELIGKALSHYAVGSLLVRGRSGLIFRATDTRDNRPVALKVLLPEFTRDDEAVQRLVRAMKTMLPLRHPNLVAVYGAGKTGTYCWIAMEYIEGENLAERIRRTNPLGTFDWDLALRVAIHVARALEHAHENAIIHRNVTPENVLLRRSDQVAKLGDLVLAKAVEGMLAEEITRRGEMVGDVTYMSPERTAGVAEVDGRSDLYSLGALVYAVLAGHPPFQGNSVVETAQLIREADPVPLTTLQPAIPAAFAAVVLKLLEKRPEDRYQTAGELLQELNRIAAEQGVAV